MIFFLHIPKTAGTTFYDVVKANHAGLLKPKMENNPEKYLKANILKKNTAIRLPGGYESAPQILQVIENLPLATLQNISFIGGHVGHGFHIDRNIDISYISFIRNPRDRIFSDYKEHCKEGRFFYKTLEENNFDFNIYLLELQKEKLDNILTRQLAGPYDFFLQERKPVNTELYDLAVQNIASIIFFRMEDFDRALSYLKLHYGWKKLKYTRKNESVKHENYFKIDEELLNEIIGFDMKLYSFIKPFQKKYNVQDLLRGKLNL